MSQPKHSETLEGIKYKKGSMQLIDQRQLPFTVVYDEVKTVQDVHQFIKEMRVRGAPAIAVSAALGIAIHIGTELENKTENVAAVSACEKFLLDSLDFVATSRPTAVNLFNAVALLKKQVAEKAKDAKTAEELANYYIQLAEDSFAEDIAFNHNILNYGTKDILSRFGTGDKKVNILTICNTGALATARYGTALGVVRGLHYEGRLERVYACETRPWNQGARLTVFECVHEEIPVTLIVDNAVSSLMRSTKIDAVIVGADRVCQNGDTANKIGTYNVAVAAKHHGVPFYVAAPTTTLDPKTASGADVTIEEREPKEITHNMATGNRVVADGPTLNIWNPVFDVTPAELITGGIITDRGVFQHDKESKVFDIAEIVKGGGAQ